MRVGRVLLVGYASVDVIIASTAARAALRIGGVCTNVARVLGSLRVPTTYFTPTYRTEFGLWLERELADHAVEWRRLDSGGPPAVFLARLDPSGDLESAEFIDSNVCSVTDVGPVDSFLGTLGSNSLLLSCTDVPVGELKRLRDFASARNASFGLISSSDDTAERLGAFKGALDFLSINLRELARFCGDDIPRAEDATASAREFLVDGGAALVTMGDRGALLVEKSADDISWLQPVPRLSVANTVGAGDVMTGALLSGLGRFQSGAQALDFATRVVLSYLSHNGLDEYPRRALIAAWTGELEAMRQING